MKGEDGTVKMRNTAYMKKLEPLPEHLTPSDRPELDNPPDSTPPVPRRTEHIRKQPKSVSDYELYRTTMDSVALDRDSNPG